MPAPSTVMSKIPAPWPAGLVKNTRRVPSAKVTVPSVSVRMMVPSMLARPLAEVNRNVFPSALPSNHSAAPPGAPSATYMRIIGDGWPWPS